MPLFTEAVAHDLLRQVLAHYNELGQLLGLEERSAALDQDSPIYHDLVRLIAVANGIHERTESMVREVEASLGRVVRLVVDNPLHIKTQLPSDFWHTDLGILVSRARWWVSSDDLITISNAAALAFDENNQANRMRIARAMDNGTLEWIPDPSVANTQQNRRVLRSQVERLRDLRRLPE